MTFPRYHRSRKSFHPTPWQRLRLCLDQADLEDARIIPLRQYPPDACGPRFRVDIPARFWNPSLLWMDDNEFLFEPVAKAIGYGWMLSSYISDGFRAEDDWYSFAVIWLDV